MARIAPKFFGGGDSVLILKTKILAQKFSPAETLPTPRGWLYSKAMPAGSHRRGQSPYTHSQR